MLKANMQQCPQNDIIHPYNYLVNPNSFEDLVPVFVLLFDMVCPIAGVPEGHKQGNISYHRMIVRSVLSLPLKFPDLAEDGVPTAGLPETKKRFFMVPYVLDEGNCPLVPLVVAAAPVA